MTSSASYPSNSTTASLKPSTMSRILPRLAARSLGIFSRVAVYSGYSSSRKLLPASKTTAR
jgi:hypothetical protein